LCCFEEDPEVSFDRRDYRRGFGAVLQTDLACVEHVQEQKMYVSSDVM